MKKERKEGKKEGRKERRKKGTIERKDGRKERRKDKLINISIKSSLLLGSRSEYRIRIKLPFFLLESGSKI